MQRILLLLMFMSTLSICVAQDAGDYRFGLQLSPVNSWMSTNDNQIGREGSNTGIRFGVIGEKYFQPNYALVGAFSIVTNQGGNLRYINGGNYLPKSDLSNPAWNSGDKPLPDGVEITYQMSFVEFMAGLKLRTNEIGEGLRVYAEFPFLALSIATGTKGDIVGSGINTEDERIGPDVANLSISWGGGAGIEFNLGESLILAPGLFYQQSLTDITRDKGRMALELIDNMGTPDPTDDTYQTRDEDSRGRLGSLTLRIAIMF